MDVKKVKVVYSEQERNLLKQCVLASRVLSMPKQTDKISNIQKLKAWEEVTKNFNSHAVNVPRTVKQLKKLWENIKYRRKAELGEARRQLIRTGGGPYSPPLCKDDPDLDALGAVDVELRDTVDSESLPTGSYEITTEDYVSEAALRVARINKQILHDKELHELRCQVIRAELEYVQLKKELLLKGEQLERRENNL